jgi:cell wall-associated NlpC family hydrolase
MKALLEYAKMFVGVPYVWGGSNSMRGFDCSGFVQFILQSVGVDPKGDQTAQTLHDLFLHNGGVPLTIPKAGAICFYGKTESSIYHVAFALSEHQIIEAGGGDHTTTSVAEAAKRDACVRIRPADARKDLVSIVLPNYPLWVTNG